MIRCLRCCSRFNYVGTPRLDTRLTFPLFEGCKQCKACSKHFESAESQRLRVIEVLLNNDRAPRLSDLTITDQNALCNREQDWATFMRRSVGLLRILLSKAHHIRYLT